ncbi:dTDP-4-dehydrorhamnose reductase [Carnobacterium maltaromaticum]|uniref:dTDP-4-dehydrorhamnose reductase n=1 Tax=Carnobacterium maltaromaticum TaxID=2751 RepID=UPI000704C374|nr:dTDP-4-dehydrorhamnose reductase [Carnobacterium maltaromaticum]KRN72021.1 dTDP-4-dehydrorhamnose reductase [Carnobacterium maltaromaticum]TFJ71970.1 dTDP-4-dehydrorhamnose reductase [Carnobacterium maltaromaticum]TFJ76883.1 dTDP-4-dehydrorhamnose reductase [Carnobacterium maltaromaticum]CRH18803.1 dTDP-4-dehydrorhamnose reductase [Carnobacterium maltaromaticum]CRH21480.1 dTDP-4-dehydrorhamnose reductase [Carnobacterium maltaromaticum]
MTVLITGGNGQLGTELKKLLDEQGVNYISADAKEMDITDSATVDKFVAKVKPEVIYHCAAYTAVDKAEDEGKELNQLINVDGTANVAKAAEANNATIVYISTDYIFDGNKKTEYKVDDVPNPQNEYGRAKYEGELEIQKYASKYYIIRTSWVYGEFGANFVFTMQKLAKTHPKLTVVDDQYGRPTWTRDLAEFMTFIVEKKAEYGVYHFSNDNSCTWYEFATEILKDIDVEIAPVDSSAFPQKAKRPEHSIMDLSKTKALAYQIPTWQDSLKNMLNSL